MSHRSRALHRLAPSLLGSALALLAGASAWSQERSPYYIGISQSFSRDSNVYRTATNEVSETISSTGLVAGFDQPIGRQRFYGDASAQVNRYRNVDALNNKSYALTAGLDWETVDFLSGVLRYSTRDSLADFGTLGGSTQASDQNTQQFLASLRYGVTSKLSLDTSYEHRRLKYKNDLFATRNYEQNAVSGGVRWGTSGVLVFGLGVRATKGKSPDMLPVPDELKRRDIDLTTTWTPSGFSTLNGRISSTKETHNLASSGEVSGATGAVSWNYRPTAKLSFTTSLTRDTGTETTFIASTGTGTGSGTGAGSSPLAVDNSRLSTMAMLELGYAMTSKISLRGDAHHRKGSLTTGGDEKVTGYGIGLSYAPTRNALLSCNVAKESRDLSGATAYDATTTSCSAQLTLR